MNGTLSSTLGRALAAAVFAAVIAGIGSAALAQAVTVTVGGQPLYLSPGPVERGGRVFVPLRGIFERLGATVVYDAGVINATKRETTISIRIGSTQATVDGRHQYLDVAPFILGATTYVPLRFVAQSLGADVGYDGSTRVVAITVLRPPPPAVPIGPPPMPPPPNPPAYSVVRLRAEQPRPDAYVNDRFATIAAQFTHEVDSGTIHIRLDGSNITSQSGITPTGFSYRPPAPLTQGTHTVRVTGNDVSGSYFDRSWSFTTNAPAPPPPPLGPIQLRAQQPPPSANIANRFANISAEFSRAVDAGSVRVWLDGNNVTNRSGVSASGFSFAPPAPLDFGSHTVRVAGQGAGGMPFDRSWSFSISGSPAPVPGSPVQLRAQQPAPGSRIDNRFATIAANFTINVNAGSVVVRLDGNDITSRSGVSPSGFSYTPPAPLDRGSHSVRVTGRGLAGLGFDRSWSFTVNQGNPQRIHLTIGQPAPNAPVGRTFVVQGNTVANGRIRVTAGASPSANGQFNGTAVAGPLGNFRLSVTLQTLLGQQAVTVKIHATDPATSQSTETTLQLRLNQ